MQIIDACSLLGSLPLRLGLTSVHMLNVQGQYTVCGEKQMNSKSEAKPSDQSGRKIAKGSSSEVAYRQLRDEIVSLKLEPGANLDEAGTVSRLGLSRTPVRKALVMLSGEGLVELLPNRGARVATMDWNEIREHLEDFEMMQRLVTRWAAIRR